MTQALKPLRGDEQRVPLLTESIDGVKELVPPAPQPRPPEDARCIPVLTEVIDRADLRWRRERRRAA